MTDQKKQNERREFKAVWAADEDWKSNDSKPTEQEVGFALKQFNKIGARFDKAAYRLEEERLPCMDRLKRLPICTLRSIPLVTSLTAAYWIVAFVIVWLISDDVLFRTSSALWLDVLYITTVLAVFVGYREARYPEGILKPSLKHLLNYMRSDWFLLLPTLGIISFIGLENDAKSDPISLQIFTVFAIILALLWTSELAAYKPTNQDEKK